MEFREQLTERKDSGEIKRQIQRYLRWWPLFAACVLAGLVIAWLYLRYATPQYMSKASVYVKTDGNQCIAQVLCNDASPRTTPPI